MGRIRLEQLTKVFPGPVVAVDRLNLDVAAGEFVSLVGPSGCGKTTTLRMVAGLETPTAGTVRFGDRPMDGIPPQARNVGLVFQHHAVFPTMSVFDNVAYGLAVRKVNPRELRRRVMEHLEMVGLASLADRMPGSLSGGQQQRVALARALVIEPTVLLLDEPLSHLDARLRLDIRKEIRKIQRQLGITTLYVTHDQEEALSVSDRVGVMNEGRLEQLAPPAALYRRPANRFVASFIGDGTVLDGRLLSVERAGARVRVGSLLLEAREWVGKDGSAHGPLDPGPVWVCIRPEAVVPAGPEEPGAVQGTVTHLEFLGPVRRGEVTVEGVPRPVAFTFTARESHDLAVGRPVAFRFDPAAIAIGPDR